METEGLCLCMTENYDLILLDLASVLSFHTLNPGTDGLEILRQFGNTTQYPGSNPVRPRDQIEDKVNGLDLGSQMTILPNHFTFRSWKPESEALPDGNLFGRMYA